MHSIVELYKSFGEIKEPTWLDGRSYSEAFVICLGAGPWNSVRRKLIQEQALNKLNERDISDLSIEECNNFYPLNWQNKFLLNMRNESFRWKNAIVQTSFETRRLQYTSFNEYWIRCKKYTTLNIMDKICKNFYEFCGNSNGTKVLSLFIRDCIKFDLCFPIDRHVKRFLQEHNFPTKEEKMIDICLDNRINPRLFAIGIAQKMGIDNPDWSIK